MKGKKHIPIALVGIMMVTTQTVGAALVPSLESQMAYQAQIDQQVQINKIDQRNTERLEKIRRDNLARMSQTNTLDENARSAALARPVYRNPITTTYRTTPVSISTSVIKKKKSTPTVNNAAPVRMQKTVSTPVYTSHQTGNVDIARVEQAWLGWVNELRLQNGLLPYVANTKLSNTAQEWAEFSRDR